MAEKSDKTELNNQIVEVLKSCYDPEIPVNIYELGLIYGIEIDDENNVTIKMTLTSPACPVAGSLPPEVENKVRKVNGVRGCIVELVWEPLWGIHMMSEEAKLQLGLY
jgi:FeS assembly SUF system protein